MMRMVLAKFAEFCLEVRNFFVYKKVAITTHYHVSHINYAHSAPIQCICYLYSYIRGLSEKFVDTMSTIEQEQRLALPFILSYSAMFHYYVHEKRC